jgi:hypothetical protein
MLYLILGGVPPWLIWAFACHVITLKNMVDSKSFLIIIKNLVKHFIDVKSIHKVA